MPPDRVFGFTEKSIRKKEVIYQPSEYIDIIGEHATVVKVGVECDVLDWKMEKEEFFKAPAQFHFQLASCRRFVLTRTVKKNILVRGEYTYKTDSGVTKTVTKKGKRITSMNPAVILTSNSLKPAKKIDVNNLLKKHYGDQWKDSQDLVFYKNIIDGAVDDFDEEQQTCEPIEEINATNV